MAAKKKETQAMKFLRIDSEQDKLFAEIKDKINEIVFEACGKYAVVGSHDNGIQIGIHSDCPSTVITQINDFMGLEGEVHGLAHGSFGLEYKLFV